MSKMIKLHHYISGKSIWLNPDAIISVVDETTKSPCAGVYTFAGEPLAYSVAETPETVVEMIEQARNPLYSYTCVNLAKEARKEY